MRRVLRVVLLLITVATLVTIAMGCKKANPDDPVTQALAKQFMAAIFVSHDAPLAESLLVPITTYGYVTPKITEDTVANEIQKGCSTPADSVQVWAPGGNVTIADISANDTSKGITARTAWLVSSKYLCAGQTSSADRTSVVYLEKVNDKWGVAKVDWQIDLGRQSNN